MGSGSLWGGVIAGYGKASEKRQQDLLNQEIARRAETAQFYQGVYENPKVPREMRARALQNVFEIRQTPYDKKLPKHLTDVTQFLAGAAELRGQPGLGEAIPQPTPEGLVGSAMGEAREAGVTYAPPGGEFGGPLEASTEQQRAFEAAEAEAETATELNRLQDLRKGGFVPQTHTRAMAPEPFTAPAGAFVAPKDPETGELIPGAGGIVPDVGGAAGLGSVEDFVTQERNLRTQAKGAPLDQAEIYEATKAGREAFMMSDPNLVAIRQLQLGQLQTEAGATLTRLQFDQAARLQGQFTAESANYIETKRLYDNVVASSRSATPAGDLSMIFAFMKILDPGSVVRETEFANAQNAGNIPVRVRAAWNRAFGGGEMLVPEIRADFLEQARKIMGAAQVTQDENMGRFSRLASDQQIPPRFVIFDYSVGLPPDFTTGGVISEPGVPDSDFDPLVQEP